MNFKITAALMALACSTNLMAADTAFTLTSPDMTEGQPLTKLQEYNGFGCDGGNRSPVLSWSGVPEGTKSLALTVYDPDAPTGSGWWHWLVLNIPADMTSLPAGIDANGTGLPEGTIQTRTDFGAPGFGGPCPPVGHGVHHYQFTLHALKVDRLDLPADIMPAAVGFNLNANRIGKTTFTATYQR